jgi:hypothetical protein
MTVAATVLLLLLLNGFQRRFSSFVHSTLRAIDRRNAIRIPQFTFY